MNHLSILYKLCKMTVNFKLKLRGHKNTTSSKIDVLCGLKKWYIFIYVMYKCMEYNCKYVLFMLSYHKVYKTHVKGNVFSYF